MGAGLSRVFIVGHDKCGARSIADLFCRNGYKVLRWQKERVANKISENFHLSKAPLFGIGYASLHIGVESLGGLKSVMGRSYFQHILHNFLDTYCPVSLFIYNYREQKPWLQSRLKRSGGKYFAACRNHVQASREGDYEVTTLDVADWWQKAWCSHEKRCFLISKNRKIFSNLILIPRIALTFEVFFGKVGSKIKSLSLSRKGVDKKKIDRFRRY